MKTSAYIACLLALGAATMPSPVLAQIVSTSDPATLRSVSNFHQARGQTLWFGKDDASAALIDLLADSQLDGLNPSAYPVSFLRGQVARARTGSSRDRRNAELALSMAFVRYASDVARERDVGMLYVDDGARPRPVSPLRILQVAASAPSLELFVERMEWMHPYYPALRRALKDELANDKRADRIRLLTLNRDRARALPRGKGDYILVNSAAARLDFYKAGKVEDSMRVVVGETAQQTPMMAGMVRYAILNPYWHVPPDLATTRLAPRVLSEGLIYLKKKGYEIVSDWSRTAKVLPASAVDWKAVAAGKKEVLVRQRPGPLNGMGEIKFMFPNDLGIYLHDTPGKTLFHQSERTFSAGCVRLEDAAGLKKLILGETQMATSSAPEQYVPLSKPVPVFLAYLTAYPQDGKIVIRNDVYNRDKAAKL